MMEEEIQDSTEIITMEGVESTDSEPANNQIIEPNTSQSISRMSVCRSDDRVESEDRGSDPTNSSAVSDEHNLNSLIASVNSDDGRHCSSTSEKYLSFRILKAVRQKDKNSLLQVLKTCKENGFPQSGKMTNTCWKALRLAISSQSHKECLELLLEYNNGILISLDDEVVRRIYLEYDFEKDVNILLLLHKGYAFHKRSDKNSILHLAAWYGKSRIISLISNHLVNINIKDSEGSTPLHLSVQNYQLEATRTLLQSGADVLLADNVGDLPLHCAIRSYSSNSRDLVRLLVEHDSTTINYRNNRGETPFFRAVAHGREVSLISYLLEKGALTVKAGSEITAFQLAASCNYNHLLPLLLESVPIRLIEKYCLLNISSYIGALNTSIFTLNCVISLTCSAIDIGTNCLVDLMNRNLPEAVLQAPSLLRNNTIPNSYDTYQVISPLAYLFKQFFVSRNERFDPCLDILLKQKITMLDQFQSAHPLEWPDVHVSYTHPFSEIFHSSVPLSEQLHYFHLLNANEVTVDYCLRCYHNNTKSFSTLNNDLYDLYYRCYKHVIMACRHGDVETLKLFISTSDILEPDILSDCICMLQAAPQAMELFPPFYKDIRHVLEYLVSLKPADQERHQHSFSQYFTPSEKFSNVTLRGLCRTVIREQLRERTFQENLLNFRRKIFELPLPNLLKDYLLFKI